MKPIFARIPENLEDVFAVRVTHLPSFSTEFHFHKECQLVYVRESEGKRIVGDSVETFAGDEVILIGSDLPHVWYNDEQYFRKNETRQASSIALFFDPNKLLELMSHFGSVKKLEAFLAEAKRGIKFTGATKELLKQQLVATLTQDNLQRLISLLQIVDAVANRSHEYELLASSGFVNSYQEKNYDRIDKVLRHVFDNFTTDIELDTVAAIANMNKQAFCRYFKSRTKKTFVQFVNEVRIGHACKLITNGEGRISSVAYDSGFNSLSNFNKVFKEVKGITPKEYTRMIQS
ncbi:AraC family transcriptional regulator [Pinibacter aurantiacus]|uniref:AraC family transcriptional regulator n=1 Tax=Pinibacter aurantiacus TaxID=2851599 RepID=A0A9E2S525_9BACT|nr:AraC family transcriptional regulator [Pinibacter aurantiacus]MBV4355871.1 AraC family transcriptional regulator [Pinibacter aurantiacus]